LTWAALAAAVFLVGSGCASSRITSSWQQPGLQPFDFQKTLVVFMSDNAGIRRTAEDRLVNLIGDRTEAVASYTLFPDKAAGDDAARTAVRDAGFDSAVVMRMVSREQQLNYTPGMTYPVPYRSFYGYYGYGWGRAYEPGYLTTDTVVTVETNLYSVRDDELLWSGVSETFNQTETSSMVESIASAVGGELRSKGLVR